MLKSYQKRKWNWHFPSKMCIFSYFAVQLTDLIQKMQLLCFDLSLCWLLCSTLSTSAWLGLVPTSSACTESVTLRWPKSLTQGHLRENQVVLTLNIETQVSCGLSLGSKISLFVRWREKWCRQTEYDGLLTWHVNMPLWQYLWQCRADFWECPKDRSQSDLNF